MADLFADAETMVTRVRKSHMARSVEFRRSGETAATVSATIGKTVSDHANDDGIITKRRVRDYLILTSDFPSGWSDDYPKVGDVIAENHTDHWEKYEVVPNGGEPAYERTGQYGKTLRIHTKYIGDEAI